MPTTHKPSYPVVDPEPTMGKALLNLNFSDYLNVGALTLSGFTTGWFIARKATRGPNARFVGGIGFLAGLTLAHLNSTQRLMGLEPNESEVRRWGVVTDEDMAAYNYRQDNPNFELIGATRPKYEGSSSNTDKK